MLREIAVERYSFHCPWCRRAWTADYDVQYVTDDGDGTCWAFYRHNGVPVENPCDAEQILCPGCGHTHVTVDLVARRDVPLADLGSEQPRHRVTSAGAERRAAAPPLPAEHVTAAGHPRDASGPPGRADAGTVTS